MIAVLVPSRERPERARLMASSVHETATEPVLVVVIVDPDEPRLMDYTGAFPGREQQTQLVTLGERVGYTGALNRLASELWDEYDVLGAFGDDVLFRTRGWDQRVRETLETPGIAYGDDLVHRKAHPTAIFMSSVIAKSLGWLAMPYTRHLWADDAWKQLGQEAGVLRYMDGVVFEHLHPAVGKADMDATYHSVYDGFKGHADHLSYVGWLSVDLASDVAKVRAACA